MLPVHPLLCWSAFIQPSEGEAAGFLYADSILLATRHPLHHPNGPGTTGTELSQAEVHFKCTKAQNSLGKFSPSLYACGCIYTHKPRITLELLWPLHQGVGCICGSRATCSGGRSFFSIYKNTAIISATSFLLPSAPHLT